MSLFSLPLLFSNEPHKAQYSSSCKISYVENGVHETLRKPRANYLLHFATHIETRSVARSKQRVSSTKTRIGAQTRQSATRQITQFDSAVLLPSCGSAAAVMADEVGAQQQAFFNDHMGELGMTSAHLWQFVVGLVN